MAHDIFDNWFEVKPLEEGVDEEKFNEQVQKVLLILNAKDVFTQAAVFREGLWLEHNRYWKGMSVLESVWDDLTVIRNIAWGMGQTLYRYGSGFSVVFVKGATREQLREWAREWGPLTAQTSMWAYENTTIDFKGLAGRAIDPEPYYTPIMENIRAGTSIPIGYFAWSPSWSACRK